MGNFYTSYTVRGPSQASVAAFLAGRSAIVTPVEASCVVVFDEESEEQNQEVIAELASRLSREFGCPVLAVVNHDDDILWYQLHLNGERADEYDSSPGYFDGDVTAPSGGDAQQLCQAFEVDAVAEVGRVLSKAALDEDGYVFAIERHADLVGALGIPSFATAGFSQIVAGEVPEDLEERELVRIEGPDTAQAGSEPEDDARERPVLPGYYQVNPRPYDETVTAEEMTPSGWMPALWAELACSERELSEGFRQAVAAHRRQFETLGFQELGFKQLTRVLDPCHRDTGGVNYLDHGRSHYGQLIYQKRFVEALNAEQDIVVVVFSAVVSGEVLACTNNPPSPLPDHPLHTIIRVESNEVAVIYRRFLQLLKEHAMAPLTFPDLVSLQAWSDETTRELFELRARRGWFVPMSEEEVVAARRSIPPPLPGR